MSVVFASYDLQKPGQPWAAVDEALKKLKGYRALETFWFFAAPTTVKQVTAVFRRLADDNDKWFVGTASDPAGWELASADWDKWLQESL